MATTIYETLQAIALELKTVPGISDTGIDLKTQQPGHGTSASVTFQRAPYSSQRPVDRFECTITLRASESVTLADFFAFFDRDTDNVRSVYRHFRGPNASPKLLNNGAAIIVEQVRDVDLRIQEPGGAVVRRCVFDVAVSLR